MTDIAETAGDPGLLDGIEPGDVDDALGLARRLAPIALDLAAPDGFASYLGALRRLGSFDLTTARVVEPHLDARAILAQADVDPADVGAPPDATWGVYAAHSPGLRAERIGAGWALRGDKRWCSLAGRLSHALVTADTDDGGRLFALDLRGPGVEGVEEPWVSRGLAAVRSTGLHLDGAPVVPVGPPGFYLSRDGFAWGGIGVAAVWAGGVDALADALRAAAGRREPDQVALVHLGRLDATRHVLDEVLAGAARRVASGEATGAAAPLLAARVRCIVAEAAECALTAAGHALGPAPLTSDERHARLVADLTVYLRQHHAERSLADLGRLSLGA